jgi:DNA-binding response OmpR family regulator
MEYKGSGFISNGKRTILVVEDNEIIRDEICGHLEDHFNIISASTGEDALRLIISTSAIDLLITDFDLCSKLDGFDVACAMNEKNGRTNPIILVTGSNLNNSRIQQLLSISNTWPLQKPFEKSSLDLIIKTMIGRGP